MGIAATLSVVTLVFVVLQTIRIFRLQAQAERLELAADEAYDQGYMDGYDEGICDGMSK